ncbi:MAG: HAD hydrolase-like protein, partial [Thermoleophilia bacterium]
MTGFDPIIFDLDGTVVDTVALIRASFRHASRAVLGRQLPDEVLLAGVGRPLMTQMRALDAARAQELYDAYREHNHRFHDEMIAGFAGMEAGGGGPQGGPPPPPPRPHHHAPPHPPTGWGGGGGPGRARGGGAR